MSERTNQFGEGQEPDSERPKSPEILGGETEDQSADEADEEEYYAAATPPVPDFKDADIQWSGEPRPPTRSEDGDISDGVATEDLDSAMDAEVNPHDIINLINGGQR